MTDLIFWCIWSAVVAGAILAAFYEPTTLPVSAILLVAISRLW